MFVYSVFGPSNLADGLGEPLDGFGFWVSLCWSRAGSATSGR